MKKRAPFVFLLIAISISAGTWKYDFGTFAWDFSDDIKASVWIEDTDWFLYQGGYVQGADWNLSYGAALLTGTFDGTDYSIEVRARPQRIGKGGFGIVCRRPCTFCWPGYFAAMRDGSVSIDIGSDEKSLYDVGFKTVLGRDEPVVPASAGRRKREDNLLH